VAAAGHPLLSAVVALPASGGLVFTGRLSASSHPWIADHEVLGSVLLPGTGFLELAVRAGDEVGCGVVEELTLEAPLLLPPGEARQIQVAVDAEAGDGRRTVRIFSRAEDGAWTRHAEGTLLPGVREPAGGLAEWPPAGASEVDIDGAYTDLVAAGFAYGPAFRGLRAAWQRGDEIFAEVALPEEALADARRFGLHPALLDAAMHAAIIVGAREGGEKETVLPFSWNQVCLHATGATALRVRLTRPTPASLVLDVADETGAPVLSVGSMAGRGVSAGQLAG
ncbi:polyketide synthase dehydratase domain-containing protein, partial [Amycolatopsis sp. SID8362]|uniref:polyketide synthase dehydratase domain-containing protein n=1 Tax=Amycolatopsis sp. SID8362 TaxID=2690346 RepID=UPI00142CB552